jgi:hypothetical protein
MSSERWLITGALAVEILSGGEPVRRGRPRG